jgi:hypothetical protein
MKVMAYMPLHYGSDYIRESILSIKDHVDVILILYTKWPSFGHMSSMPCPDTEEYLYQLAKEAAGDKLIWENVSPGTEGEHRTMAEQRAMENGYDLLIAIDSDEVWEPSALPRMINEASNKDARYVGVNGWANFWRSFSLILKDYYAPIRFVNLNAHNKINDFIGDPSENNIYHFSCALSHELMRYKWSCHGHNDELRSDWLNEVYFKWDGTQEWLHPVSKSIWHKPMPFDKTDLPLFMHNHKFFNQNLI